MRKAHATVTPLPHPAPNPALSQALAPHLRDRYPQALGRMRAMLRHPRCLARMPSTWRPPTLALPDPLSGGELVVALTRHRMGPRARARVRGFAPSRQAAYLISARFSRPDGHPAHPAVAEAWVRALLAGEEDAAVHEFPREPAPTYRWCVDGLFRPVASPASLFADAA